MGLSLKTKEDFNPIWDIKNEGIPVANFESNSKGYDFYIEAIQYSVHCTDGLPISVVLQIGDNWQLGDRYRYLTVPNGVYTFPVNRLIRAGQVEILCGLANGGINAGRTISSGYYMVGSKVPQLSQFDEENVIYSLGDSIDVLGAYVTRVAGHRNYQMITSLRQNGYDCRLASLAISGNSLNQFVGYLKKGYGQIRKASVILVQHGVNDVGQGVTNNQFLANLNYLKTWRDSLYPNAKLVICKGSPSLESDTYSDSVARNNVQRGFNTQIDNFLSANTEKNIYTINMFDNVPHTPTLFTDQVHPTQAGHDLMGNILTNGMNTILGL